MASLIRGLGPAIPRPTLQEALRAAIGAGLGLFVTAVLLYLITPTASLLQNPLLIAPFAASAVLIFGVPNSPLAQPWAVVVGNTSAALIGVATIRLLPIALPAATIAVLLTLIVTAALRATHPPAGAAAMATVLAFHPTAPTPLLFALHPVLTGSALLVAAGILWNRATGRAYPFRQAAAPAPHGTADKPPERRLAPSPEVLAATLSRLRLGANVGVEDLARLIETAEAESAGAALGQITAEQMMSRDLVTAQPTTPLPDLVASFRSHRFKSLPLRDANGRPVSFGLCKGSADLIGWRTVTITPEMVGQQVAVFTSIEVKTATGRLRPEQQQWLDAVQSAGGIAGVARSVEDAEALLSNTTPQG